MYMYLHLSHPKLLYLQCIIVLRISCSVCVCACVLVAFEDTLCMYVWMYASFLAQTLFYIYYYDIVILVVCIIWYNDNADNSYY